MSKRKRFIITSILLSLGFIAIQVLGNQYRFVSIGILSLLTIALFSWSLIEGLGKNMTLVTLILPTIFTLGVGLFWFLLPTTIFARIPVVIFYGFGIYTLLLTSNIYTVGAVRSIALLRAARGVGFVLTLITVFLVFDTIFSLRINILPTSISVFLLGFLIFLQGLWVVGLQVKPSKEIFVYSLTSALILAEISLNIFFWPVTVIVGSLFLTVSVYALLGLSQARMENRLFSQTVREYLIVTLLVFVGMFIATRWGF